MRRHPAFFMPGNRIINREVMAVSRLQLEQTLAEVKDRYYYRLYLESLKEDGGPGSGNWGHAGRKGMRGGSAPGGGAKDRIFMGGGSLGSSGHPSDPKQSASGASKGAGAVSAAQKAEKEAHDQARAKMKEKIREAEEVENSAYDLKKEDFDGDAAYWKERRERMRKGKDLRSEADRVMEEAGAETYTEKLLFQSDIEYIPVAKHETPLSEEEIVRRVAGGDMTEGSCASAALAYIAQKQGYDVLDFRGGKSLEFFANRYFYRDMIEECGGNLILSTDGRNNIENGKKVLSQLQEGTEYLFTNSIHASVVRRQNGKLQYMELQNGGDYRNGWIDFADNPGWTLDRRFGGERLDESSLYHDPEAVEAAAVDINELGGKHFERILGYLNTNEADQMKGSEGRAK